MSLQDFHPEKLVKGIRSMVVFALLIVLCTFTFYFVMFNGGLSSSQNNWGMFGDFIGGTLNPILSFLSLIALLFTIILQTRQAEISKNELELSRQELIDSRKELARSATAHEKTEQAQQQQARIQEMAARVTILCQLITMKEMDITRLTGNDVDRTVFSKQIDETTENKKELAEELLRLYKELQSMST